MTRSRVQPYCRLLPDPQRSYALTALVRPASSIPSPGASIVPPVAPVFATGARNSIIAQLASCPSWPTTPPRPPCAKPHSSLLALASPPTHLPHGGCFGAANSIPLCRL